MQNMKKAIKTSQFGASQNGSLQVCRKLHVLDQDQQDMQGLGHLFSFSFTHQDFGIYLHNGSYFEDL